MTPAAIIEAAARDGVHLALSPDGTIKARGKGLMVQRWAPVIREQKAGVMVELREAANAAQRVGGDEVVEMVYCSPATHFEILARRPGAIAVESIELARTVPTALLSTTDERAIHAWLSRIGEANREVIGDVLNQCSLDAEAREYFLRRALDVPDHDVVNDDRRHCAQCANLTWRGLCLAARRGEIVASRDYEPIRYLPRRCEGFAPGEDDPDRRPGKERWPGLIQQGSSDGCET